MPPAFSWFLALRYLVTRWVSLVGTLGVTLAVWSLILVISIFSGFIGEARRGIQDASPDLLVHDLAPGGDYRRIREALAADPDVAALAPRLTIDGMLYAHGGRQMVQHTNSIPASAASAANDYVLMVGIDFALESEVLPLREWLTAVPGSLRTLSMPRPERFVVEDLDEPLAVSPERIARAQVSTLGIDAEPPLAPQPGMLLGMYRLRNGDLLEPGQRVDFVSARFVEAGETFELRKLKQASYLSGGYHTRHRFLDLSICFVDIEWLRKAMGESPLAERELVDGVSVRLRPGADAATVAARLEEALEPLGGGRALTWTEQNQTYLDAVERERTLMKIVLFAVLVIAGFLIFATLHMMVAQKIKDIGILSSLGATPGGIGAVFVLGGFAVGTVGAGVGLVTGFLSATFLNEICGLFGINIFPVELYALDRVPVNLEPEWMLQVAAGAVGLSLLISWLPARRAAKQDPIKALMHE